MNNLPSDLVILRDTCLKCLLSTVFDNSFSAILENDDLLRIAGCKCNLCSSISNNDQQKNWTKKYINITVLYDTFSDSYPLPPREVELMMKLSSR